MDQKAQESIMNGGQELDSIPDDLIVEIFSRLPAKTIARCRCLSKRWGSMLRRPCFTELFLTKSWACPRLLFAVDRDDVWSFYFSPQPQDPYDKSSITAGFYMKFPKVMRAQDFYGLTNGLIFFSSMQLSTKSEDTGPVIFNPRTRQYALLPKLDSSYESSSYESSSYESSSYEFLGFDPVDKQFKLLSIAYHDHKILTLGNGIMRWRKIECPLDHVPYGQGVCINGVVYYMNTVVWPEVTIVCFDVRSEEFKFSDAKCFCHVLDTHLINYKGKLGLAGWMYDDPEAIDLHLWVLEDVEKHEWSKCVYNLIEYKRIVDPRYVSVVGVTPTGEIVLSDYHSYQRFFVFYFSPERKTLQRVEIQGMETDSRFYTFMDHVEDLTVNDVKQLKSSRALNIIRERPKPQHSTSQNWRSQFVS